MGIFTTEQATIAPNPSTGEMFIKAWADTESSVQEKVGRARAASEKWRATPLEERIALIARLHGVLVQEVDYTVNVLSKETGRPVQESLGAEILPTLDSLKFLVDHAERHLKPQRLKGRDASAYADPFGVIGVIGTWNYPLFLNLVTISQALVAGNAVVWKPSELAISSAKQVVHLLEKAGFPQGVLQVVYGEAEVGRALTQADCDKYVFTGGVATGRAIMAELALRGKPCVMELSGNDAFIVCETAPLELAARSAVWGRVCNGGQSCVAPQRFYVVRSVYEAFLEAVRVEVEALRPETLTPLRTQASRERCHTLVKEAKEQGARVLSGGERMVGDGYYYAPTLLADCEETMAVMAEDLFAPVLAVCAVEDTNEAITRTNGNSLGLGASVWTQNRSEGSAIAQGLRVGLVSINDVLTDAAQAYLPFGGVRSSGFGKQRGLAGLEEFVARKVVVHHSPTRKLRHLFPYYPAAVDLLRALVQMKGTGGIGEIPYLVRSAQKWQEQEQKRKHEGERRQ